MVFEAEVFKEYCLVTSLAVPHRLNPFQRRLKISFVQSTNLYLRFRGINYTELRDVRKIALFIFVTLLLVSAIAFKADKKKAHFKSFNSETEES